jgi:hypothetical protein
MPSNFHFPLGLGRTAPKKSPGKKPQTPPATPDEVKQILVKDVVSQIASKLGNTTQAIRVQVAGGEEHLDRAATFMGQQLWTRASDELEKASPFSKQEDESFRQYDLGVIYEAIAYDSKTFSDQKANIFKASEYYDKALELNPKQKYFVETVARSKDAIARFKALDAMQLADKKAAQKTETAQPDGKSRPARTLTASDVVELYTAGVDEEQIKDAIEKSSLQFDPFDKDTMLKIKKSKLPITIQNEMRKKVGAPLLHTPSEPATRNAAKKTS